MTPEQDRQLSLMTVSIVAIGLVLLLGVGELMKNQGEKTDSHNQNMGLKVSPPR